MLFFVSKFCAESTAGWSENLPAVDTQHDEMMRSDLVVSLHQLFRSPLCWLESPYKPTMVTVITFVQVRVVGDVKEKLHMNV